MRCRLYRPGKTPGVVIVSGFDPVRLADLIPHTRLHSLRRNAIALHHTPDTDLLRSRYHYQVIDLGRTFGAHKKSGLDHDIGSTLSLRPCIEA